MPTGSAGRGGQERLAKGGTAQRPRGKWAVRQEKEEFQEVRRSPEQVGNLGVSQLVSDTEYK